MQVSDSHLISLLFSGVSSLVRVTAEEGVSFSFPSGGNRTGINSEEDAVRRRRRSRLHLNSNIREMLAGSSGIETMCIMVSVLNRVVYLVVV